MYIYTYTWYLWIMIITDTHDDEFYTLDCKKEIASK